MFLIDGGSRDWSEYSIETAIARWPHRTSQDILNSRVGIIAENPRTWAVSGC